MLGKKEVGAKFDNDKDRRYRYALWRIWDREKEPVMFIGLNPSLADESYSNPTVRRVIQFAKDWGYGGVYMMNLYNYITASPDELKRCADPVGRDADKWLRKVAAICNDVVFAWGRYKHCDRRDTVVNMFPQAMALVINKDGSPRHPLYVKADVTPVNWCNT